MSKPNTIQDILLKLVVCEPTTLETGCWEYPHRLKNGYCLACIGGRRKYAHRLVYEHFVGAVPEGKDLHHRCENHACANFEHLEPLTRQEHSRDAHFRTHCKNGHPFDEENTINGGGQRTCRKCAYARTRAYRATSKGKEVGRNYLRAYRAKKKSNGQE